MSWYLDTMEKRLSETDARWLKQIYAPKVVAVPPSDARRFLCVMPDGELRCYGEKDKQTIHGGSGEAVYIASRDCGLSWKTYPRPNGSLGAAVRSPWSGRYLAVGCRTQGDGKGLYVYTSETGPDDTAFAAKRIDDKIYQVVMRPVAIESLRRWFCCMHYVENYHFHPVVAVSDDDGETWRLHHFPANPDHEAIPPHKSIRWQNSGAEPDVVELPDGRIMMIARNSLDVFYAYYSSDGGDTWTEGAPSDFHGTLTTPIFLRLHDGRALLFWCNTQPLPELDHTKLWPPVNQFTLNGWGEDVFTNRDANHAAITEDGVHWRGFREMYLNDVRNNADFRSCGGSISAADKSVHQFQAIELPFNKVLVAFGQHEISRRLVIFDVNWLYETERRETFSRGLEALSTQVYCKSISGSYLYSKGLPGHCAWNRTNGALLVPDPDATLGEVLQICRIRDPRLFSEVQGAVWNFPAAVRGTLKTVIRIDGEGLRLSLCDRWFNPIDTTVGDDAQFSIVLTARELSPGLWHTLRMEYDTEKGENKVFLGENHLTTLPLQHTAPNGISYLHLQSTAEAEDLLGAYVRSMEMQAN